MYKDGEDRHKVRVSDIKKRKTDKKRKPDLSSEIKMA